MTKNTVCLDENDEVKWFMVTIILSKYTGQKFFYMECLSDDIMVNQPRHRLHHLFGWLLAEGGMVVQ